LLAREKDNKIGMSDIHKKYSDFTLWHLNSHFPRHDPLAVLMKRSDSERAAEETLEFPRLRGD
jgi:hypothetical protein